MSGVFPPKRVTSGRKQWTLHDGPRSSLKRLRNQLANDGCPESQVVLAKQLLEEESELEDKQENARSGVYWLIKASEQGNTEATQLLKQCLANGKGITEHNYLDVKTCINMTQDEKLARRAAREMFASMSNGGDYITSDQLQRRMLFIDKDGADSKIMLNGCNELANNFDESESEDDVDWEKKSESNEKLTEDHLVAAAVNYSHGELPGVNKMLSLTDPNLGALDEIPFIYRSVLHPILALKIIYYKLIRFLGNFGCFFTGDLQVIFLLLYMFLTSENVLYFIPMIGYYSTIGVMVVNTFRMLQTKREFYDFHIWSGLFIAYSGGSLNADEAEFQFIRNNLKPYGHFFIALLMNLLFYPFIAELYVPQSELAVFAFCLTFMTLFGFMYKKRSKTVVDYVVLLSFAVNVLAKYPYETDPVVTQGWRFLDLKIPSFASYVIGNGIEFCINFRTVLYSVIPFLFANIAYRENWHGIYKFLIPHCVTLSWLQIVIISSQGATMFGLIRGTLALVGFVLFLPLLGVTTVLLPIAAVAKYLLNHHILTIVVIITLLTVATVALTVAIAKTRFKHYTLITQTVFAFIALYFLLQNSFSYPQIEGKNPVISYELYQKHCHETSNMAQAQIKCSLLQNIEINWTGYVKTIKIKSTRNKYKYLFDKLPAALRNQLTCYYGDVNELFETRKCHLEKHNVYDFELTLKMTSSLWKSPEIILELVHEFRNFTLNIKNDDQVWFKGTLKDELGGSKPRIKINEIACLTCEDTSSVKKIDENYDYKQFLKDTTNGFKIILNFIFFPVLVIK